MTRAGLLALVWIATPAHGVQITSADLDRGGINPSRSGFATDTLRVAFVSPDPDVDVRVTLGGEGENRTLTDTLASGGTFQLTIEDTTGGPIPLAEGVYTVSVALEDSKGTATTALDFLVDESAPLFHAFELTGPEGSFGNGDYVPLEAVMNETIDAFTLDVSELDDAGSADDLFVRAHDDTTYGLLYRISPENGVEDADDLLIRATATDRFGNAATSEDVVLCLSNFPPLFSDKHLVDAALDTIPDDTAFTSGDTIRLRTRFQMGPTASLAPHLTLDIRADLSDVDSEFHLFTNPATLDTSYADTLIAADAIAVGYVHLVTAVHSYTLSGRNLRQDGSYNARVTADDEGCGSAAATPPFRIRLADLGPAPPVIDPPAATILREGSIVLLGDAPGAADVRLEREDGTSRVAASLDTTTARFSAEVQLQEGRNRIVAISSDAFGHDSAPSAVLEVFRITEATLTVGPRVRPGDSFEVALFERADRLDLDIFNLAGDRLWHESTTSAGAVHAFTWNGRTGRGDRAGSGPYVARVTIHRDGRKRALNEAFVFTRK